MNADERQQAAIEELQSLVRSMQREISELRAELAKREGAEADKHADLRDKLWRVSNYFAADAYYADYEKHSPTIQEAIEALSPRIDSQLQGAETLRLAEQALAREFTGDLVESGADFIANCPLGEAQLQAAGTKEGG